MQIFSWQQLLSLFWINHRMRDGDDLHGAWYVCISSSRQLLTNNLTSTLSASYLPSIHYGCSASLNHKQLAIVQSSYTIRSKYGLTPSTVKTNPSAMSIELTNERTKKIVAIVRHVRLDKAAWCMNSEQQQQWANSNNQQYNSMLAYRSKHTPICSPQHQNRVGHGNQFQTSATQHPDAWCIIKLPNKNLGIRTCKFGFC